MQIDDRALNFIQKAKAAGFSQQEVYDELVAKGYEVGAPREEIKEWKAPEPEKSPYSTMDKVKYTLRAAGEAAPFGMGDLVAGYVGAQARNLADYTHGKDLKTRAKGLGKLAFGIISPEDFKKERADFIKGQEEFAKHHGGLNFAGEMAGGLLTGGAGAARNVIGKQGIKALMNAGAREGAKFGAAYGAGSALTQDTDKISVPEALKGGLVGGAGGALIGGALPPAIAIGAKGAKAGSNLVGRFFGTKKAAGREAQKILEQAGGTGVNEVVNADEGVVALKNAIKSDKGLAKEIEQIADEKLINSADTTKQIISDTLGANDIQAAKDLASAQYREVLASDPIYVPNNIYKNKGLKKAVKNAIKNDYNDELEKKGINSLYGVQAVKEELDDMIAKSMVIGKKGIAEPTKATARLQEVKAKFLENVDAVAPQYKQVREDFEKAIAPYNILGGLLKDQGRERANTIKAILTNKNKTAISDVFGKEKAEALFDALRKQSRLNENYNALYNAAHTELTKSTPIGNKAPWRESVESLGSIVGTVADMARFGGAKRLRRNIAEILLSGQKPSVKAPVKSIPQESGQSISGYLGGKLKEKGGYAMKPLDGGVKQALQYADEPFAKNPESVKNFQKWSDNAPFVGTNEEALKDPFKTGKKVVVKGYHGTQRADRVGNVFRPDRATSGPMPMFSSSEEVAQGYMKNKADTSIRANEDISYENWFRIKNNGKEVKLDEAWYKLSPKQREEIAKNAPHIRQDDQALNIIYDKDNLSGLGGYREHLREANGNHLKALVDEWLNSGSLYDDEGQFVEVLKKAGLKDGQFVYDNPYEIKGDVFNTYIQFKKPLVTNDIPQKVIDRLEEVAKKQPIPKPQFGVDLWDKNTRNPLEWIKDLKADYKSGKNSYVWSSIPDWVTNVLKDFGYDGIIDRGGKGGGAELHRVYIPFKSNQIKSVNNKGTFSKRSPNIYKSIVGGLGISQILKSKENK